MLRYWIITIWIVFSRTYDAYSTYLHTPDLSKEANPLSSVLGLGWGSILLIISLLTLYTIYAHYIYRFRPFGLMPAEGGYRFGAFSAYLYLGCKGHWWQALYSIPKQQGRFTTYIGATLAPCLAYAGVVSTVMWLLIQYTDFYPPLHRASVIYALLVAGSVALVWRWNRRMYRQYQAGDLRVC